jgi:hypothetical protein
VIVHKASAAVTAIVFASAVSLTASVALAPASASPATASPPPPASPAAPASPAPQQITVNLASTTGPVFHGATGALYGLSENGVPGADLFNPLHVRAIAAKPPGGLQHPTGDADKIAPEFFGAGGQQILVYVQDVYSDWPYQNLGLSDYLPKLQSIVTTLAASPYHDRYAYVPFNEPDGIWYGLGTGNPSQYTTNRDHFLADWTTVYRAIRSIDPHALIVGPNESHYDARFTPDFLSYAKANNVLPDIMSWHELSPSSLRTYRSTYTAYRALEKQDGLSPLPINIDEYADRYHLSNPGEMVQWLSMFEDTKVYAAMPFWDIADNYSDNAVRNAEPNGSWWLLDWYGALSGHTVSVTPPQPSVIDTLQGLASLDTAKKQARIIVANPAGGDTSVAINGIGRSVFGEQVHVFVQSINWTGYDGSAYTPLDVSEADYRVSGGSVTVPLPATDPTAAYQLIVTPATGARITAPAAPQTQQYLAADASLTDATVYTQGSESNPNYYTAGGKDVGSIDKPDSRVAFHVTVPRTGRYLMSVYYGNQTEDIAQQIMSVDGGPWSFVSYPPTLNWLFRSHKDQYLDLTSGPHTITFGVSDPSIGTAKGQVTLDDIQLTYARGPVPGVTGPATSYPAAYADLSGGATTVPCGNAAGGPDCAAPQSVSAPPGAGTGFIVDAGHNGYYDLGLRTSGARHETGRFRLLVSGSEVANSDSRASFGSSVNLIFDRVYLHAGINPVEYVNAGRGTVDIGSLNVAADDAAAATYAAAAPQNVLSGAAVVQANQYAYGGSDVGYIGNGAGNTLAFTGITAPRAGSYRVVVSYADDERAGSGNYNANLVDRGFTVSTSAGTNETVYARNTYSWDQFDTIELTVRLAEGGNTITFGNPAAYAPNIDKITVAPAYLP